MLMGVVWDAVGWIGGMLLLNLLVIAVVLKAGRLRLDPISGMPASALGGGTVAAMPASPVRGKIGEMRGEGLTNSCVLPV